MEDIKKAISGIISLYNDGYKDVDWPITEEESKLRDVETLKKVLINKKDVLFKSRSNGVAGINWGAMNNEDFNNLNDDILGGLAEKLTNVLNGFDRENTELHKLHNIYKGLLEALTKAKGFTQDYYVLIARLVVTFAPDKLLAVPGHSKLSKVAVKLGITAQELGINEIGTAENWLIINRAIVNWLDNNCESLGSLKSSNTWNDSIKFSCLGWKLALYCGAGNDRFETEKTFVENHKNVVYSGAPGTGKSYMAKQVARLLVRKDEKENINDVDKRIEMVQFHPSYDYTDFVEGLRPKKQPGSNNIEFDYVPGVFRQFCENALEHIEQKHVFIIDEINRGDVNKIFGELFFCIDPDKRYVPKSDIDKVYAVRTQYANILNDKNKFDHKLGKDTYGHFFVPDNVYIIATMNDIDRSVESLDFAFRRRFAWKEITWDYSAQDILIGMASKDLPKGINLADAYKRLKKLNDRIGKELGPAFCIGGSYLEKLQKIEVKGRANPYKELWEGHIKNVIQEYLRGTELTVADFEKAFIDNK